MAYLLVLFSLFLSLFGLSAQAQEKDLGEVVVTATRAPVELVKLPDAVSVITRQEIDQRQVQALYQALETYPSITIKHNGWLGQWGYIRLRGGKNQDVAVLFDGIRVYDPTYPGNDFGDLWSWLDAENIEKIEIVRGPQSSLYGSNAMTGAINFFSPKGGGPFRWETKGFYGRYETKRGLANVRGSLGPLGYYVGWAGVNAGGLYKDSKFRQNTVDANFNWAPFKGGLLKSLKLDWTTRYAYGFLNYGQWDWRSFRAYNDPHAQRRQTILLTHFKMSLAPTAWWNSTLTVGYHFNRRAYKDKDDGILGFRPDGSPVTDSPREALYRGKTYPVVFLNHFRYQDWALLTCGIEYYHEKGDFYNASSWGTKEYDDDVDTTSYFANLFLLLFDEKLALNLGGRIDDHEEFGTHGTYKIGLAYFLPYGFKFRANLATGFRAPSLFNLYDPRYGNADLDPEESTGGDIGLEQTLLGEKLHWSLVWFNTHYEERIAFNYNTWRYYNSGGANTTGLEFELGFRPYPWLRLDLNYTYTEGQEGDAERLALVPYHQIGARVHFKWQKFKGNLYYKYVSRRPAYDFSHYMPDYSRVDVTGSYALYEKLEVFFRAENLFDVDYEWAKGYRAPGLAILAGIKLKSF